MVMSLSLARLVLKLIQPTWPVTQSGHNLPPRLRQRILLNPAPPFFAGLVKSPLFTKKPLVPPQRLFSLAHQAAPLIFFLAGACALPNQKKLSASQRPLISGPPTKYPGKALRTGYIVEGFRPYRHCTSLIASRFFSLSFFQILLIFFSRR